VNPFDPNPLTQEDPHLFNKPTPHWKKNIIKFLDHYIVVILMTTITVYALFFDDLRMIVFEAKDDDYFYGVTLVSMILFLVEITLASIAIDDYVFSFFFWLDFISTISMVPDCGWIWDPITGGGDSGGSASDLA